MYKLKDGSIIGEEDLIFFAEQEGITPEEFIAQYVDVSEPQAESAGPTYFAQERRFITFPNGGPTVYEDLYLRDSAGKTVTIPQTTRRNAYTTTYPDTFEEYALQVGADIMKEDMSIAADVGKTQATGITKTAIDAKQSINEKIAKIVPENSHKEIAEEYFKLQYAPKKVYGTSSFGGGVSYDVDENYEQKFKDYLGDRYDDYLNYQDTGKLNLKNVPTKIIEAGVRNKKSKERQISNMNFRDEYGDESLELLEGMISDASGGNEMAYEEMQQQLQDKRDYEAATNTELIGVQEYNGRTYVSPDIGIVDSPRFQEQRNKQGKWLDEQSKAMEERLAPYQEKRNQYEQDAQRFKENIAPLEEAFAQLGEVNNESPIEDIDKYNSLVLQYNTYFKAEGARLSEVAKNLTQEGYELHFDLEKINNQIESFLIGDDEAKELIKNYDRLDKFVATLENGFIVPAVMLIAKGAKMGMKALDYASPEDLTEAIRYVTELEKGAINYYAKMQDQMTLFPDALTLDDSSSWDDWVTDVLINNSPSILTGIATVASYGTLGSVAAANMSGAVFFTMESGSKIGDMELTKQNAQPVLKQLYAELNNTTSNVDRVALQEEIRYYEDALTYSDLRTAFTGVAFGTIAGAAERFGNLALLQNIQKMSRAYGTSFFKNKISKKFGGAMARGLGVTRAATLGSGIEISEEVFTQLGHNFVDATVLGEKKSIFEGIDPDFLANVFISSLAIQGGPIANNVKGIILSEFSHARSRSHMLDLKNQLEKVEADILLDINADRKTKAALRKKRRALVREISDYTSVSMANVAKLTAEELERIIEINSELEYTANEGARAGISGEQQGSSYTNNLFNRLTKEQQALYQEKEDILKEAGLPNSLKNKKIDFKTSYNFGLYNYNSQVANSVKGYKQVVLKGITAEERIKEAEKYILDPKNNLSKKQADLLMQEAGRNVINNDGTSIGNGNFDIGAKISIINEAVISNTLQSKTASDFEKTRAAQAPLHEFAHAFMVSEKLFDKATNDVLSKDAAQLAADIEQTFETAFQENRIPKKLYDNIKKVINNYKSKGLYAADEMIMLLREVNLSGYKLGKGDAASYSVQKYLNNVLTSVFGEQAYKFRINTVQDALDFIEGVAKRLNQRGRLQLPEEDQAFIKESLSSGNMVVMSESQLAKVKEDLDKLGRDEDGKFDKDKFNPKDPIIVNALPGMIIAQAKKRAIKGLQFDMNELVQETLYQLLLRKDIDKFDGTKNDSLYGYLNKFIKWRIGDAFDTNPSIVTDFGEASMEDLTTQFSQEEAEDTVTRKENETKDVPQTPGLSNGISFANRLNKMQPGLINNEVRDNIFKALDKFLNTKEGIASIKLTTRLDWQKSDTNQATDNNGNKLFTNVFGEVITQREREALPANEKEKFEALMNQKLTLQPEEQKAFREMLSKFLEQELTKYLQKEIIAPPRSPRFKNLVESSFELYKIIPQQFLNDRIESWIQPKLDESGKQMRETVAIAGEYGGAKGNPIFERKKITKEEWENYWLAPGKPASSQGKLKERFAALIAQEYGKDLLIEFLNDENKLEMFLSQQKLPSINQLDNLGVQLVTALQRDPGAFKVKYSLSSEYADAVIANIDDLVKASEKLVQSRKFNKTELEKAFTKIFSDQIPQEAINGVAKFFRSEYKDRRDIAYGYKRIGALDEKTRIQSIKEALVYKAFGNFGKILQFYHDKGVSITSYRTYDGKRFLNDDKYFGSTNKQHVTNLVQDMLDNNIFTIEEVWQYLGDGLRSGTGSTVFENNQDLYNAFEDNFREADIILNTDTNKFERGGVELSRVNVTQAINGPAMMKAVLQNKSTAYTTYQQNAANARVQLEKIITRLETRIANAETKNDKDAILHSAAVFFVSQSGASNGLLRKIAELTHFETGVNTKNAMFEHMLPANVVVMLIGDRLNGNLTKAEFDAIIENGAKGVLTDKNTTEKVVNMFFKNNMPMDVDVRSANFDAYARYRNSMVSPILQGKTLQGLAGNETIVFAEAPHINSAKQVIESREKQKARSRKKYSLNTDDIVDFNPLESSLSPDSEPTDWFSDPIKIGPLQDDQAYMIYLSAAKTNDDRKYLMFNFTLYDGEGEHSTALEGNFAGKSVNPFRLFGTIGNSVIHFLENNREFEGIEFSGSGDSRIRLYNRLAELLAKKLGWNLDTEDINIAADEDGRDVEYLAKDYYIFKPKAKYSLNSLDKDFNLIIEDKFGIEEYKRFSQVVGKRRGAKIDKFNLKNWWFPPSAEDFMGLMYDVLAKGAKGDAQKQWIVDNLVIPYTHGIAQIDKARQSIKRTYRNLLAENKGITRLLQQKIEDGDYTYDQAIRVYMWNKQGDEIAGLSERDRNKLVAIVEGSQELKDFISVLMSLPNLSKGWPKPSEYWDAQTILSDLNNLTEKTNRKEFLAQFIENADVVFSEKNMNKLRAAVGNNWVEAMEDILYRMKNGTNRPSGSNRIVNVWNNWVNRSIGAIMFFNRRSAVLQTLSTVNFINWSDNNPIKAAAAFANQKQYWKDFAYIFNSDKLKERRGGLRTDVSEAEIANQADLSKGDPGAILSYLLKIGFSLTQIADSFAIASGGATFYRNRINTYVKEGLTQKEAEEKAWSDFSRISDETQQSSDPMLISQEQASVLGRLVLAFQNTSAQYTRRGRKGIRDLITGRGDFKTNLSVSIYYLAVQNIIFNALQNALFTFIPGFDDEPEDETLTEAELERKQQKDAATWARAINGTLDTILRGMGVRGAAIATLKNTIMKYYEQEEKDPFFKDNAQVVLEALNISPPIGSKARKLYNALRTKDFEKDVIEERGFDLFIDGKFKPSPIYSVIGNISAAVANVPLDRVYDETVAIAEAFDSRNSEWQRLALGLGYKTWTVGAKFEEEDLIKERAAALRKAAGIEKAKQTRAENKRKKDSTAKALNEKMLKELTPDEYLKWWRNQVMEKKQKK